MFIGLVAVIQAVVKVKESPEHSIGSLNDKENIESATDQKRLTFLQE